MPEDPAAELAALAEHLSEWLRYQRRLGWRGLPREPAAAPPGPSEAAAEQVPTLEEIRQEMGRCRRCQLYAGAKNLVFGEGSPSARLMFIGEAPGAEEDLSGRPFVGAAGQLLRQDAPQSAIGPGRGVHHQRGQEPPPREPGPPARRNRGLPALSAQADKGHPAPGDRHLGKGSLLGTKEPITRLRGQWRHQDHIRVMPTFHPSFLLRFPKERRKTWEDMQQVMEYLGEHEQD